MPYETKTHRFTTKNTQYTLGSFDGSPYTQKGHPTYPLFSSQKDLIKYFHMIEVTTPHLDCVVNTIKTVRVENLRNPSVMPYTTTYTTPLTTLKRNGKLTSAVSRTAEAWFNDRLPCYYHENSIPFADRVELFAHYIGKILLENGYEDGDGLTTSWENDTIYFYGQSESSQQVDCAVGTIGIHVDDAMELNALSQVNIFDKPTGNLAGSYVYYKDYDERDATLKPTYTWEPYNLSNKLGSVDLIVYKGEPFISEPDPEILTRNIVSKIIDTLLINDTFDLEDDIFDGCVPSFPVFVESMAEKLVEDSSEYFFDDMHFYTESEYREIFQVLVDFPKARVDWDGVTVELDKDYVTNLITDKWKEQLKLDIFTELDDNLKRKLEDATQILELKARLRP